MKMVSNKPFLILFSLVLGVLVLREHGFVATNAALERLLQADATSNSTSASQTFAASISRRLCSTYNYAPSSLDDQSEAADVSESISNLREKNTFYDLINRGYERDDLVDKYLRHFLPFFLALGIPFVFTTICFIFCLINWGCMFYPCCSTIRCGLCDKPSSKSRINIYASASIAFSFLVLGAALGTLTVFEDISSKINGTMCQSAFMLTELNDGNSAGWVGAEPLRDTLQEISDDLYNSRRLFRRVKNNLTDLEYQINDIENDLQYLETAYINNTLSRPNFLIEESYNPRFLHTIGENMSVAYDAVNYFKGNLTRVENDFDAAVSEFDAQRDIAIASLTESYNEAYYLQDDIQSSLNWLDRNGERVKKYGKNFTLGLKIALGVLIGITGFSLLSSVINLWSKYKYFKKGMYISWLLIGIFMVICWIAATILFPATVACVEVCNVVTESLNNDTFANMTFSALFKNDQKALKDSLVVCMRPNGDLLDNFPIKENLGLIDVINGALDDSTLYIEQEALPTTIDIEPLRLQLSRIQSNEALDDEKTEIDLVNLTQLVRVDTIGTPCSTMDDHWVLNSVNCTMINISPVFENSFADDFGINQQLCVPLNNWVEPTAHNITNRYPTSQFATCSNVIDPQDNAPITHGSFLRSYVRRFEQNRAKLTLLIDYMQKDVEEIDVKANTVLTDARETLKAPFVEVKDFMGNVQAKLLDPTEGLLFNTKCGFVETDIIRLHDELCVNLIPTLYDTSIALIVGATLASILTLVLYFMMRKLVARQVEYDGTRKTYPE